MILHNEFTVHADIETVWRQLLDMEGVASCLPGATITATDQAGVHEGSMRLKLGPMRVEYRGTATLSAVDESTHTAVISLSAREAKGQGSAMATIRNRLASVEGGTRVRAETELHITGPQAQFGRGVIEDVGSRVLSEFSERLEEKIAGSSSPSPSSSSEGPAAPPPPRADELDVGSLVASTPAARIAGAAAVLVLLLILLRRRR